MITHSTLLVRLAQVEANARMAWIDRRTATNWAVYQKAREMREGYQNLCSNKNNKMVHGSL